MQEILKSQYNLLDEYSTNGQDTDPYHLIPTEKKIVKEINPTHKFDAWEQVCPLV